MPDTEAKGRVVVGATSHGATGEVGAVIGGPARSIGIKTGELTANLARQAMSSAGEDIARGMVDRLGLDHGTWDTILDEKLTQLIELNGSLDEQAVRANWAARLESYRELSRHYGLADVGEGFDAAQLSESVVVALTAGGTILVFGPHTEYPGSPEFTDGGRVSITYFQGREVGSKSGSKKRLSPEVHFDDGVDGAVVVAHRGKVGIDANGGFAMEDTMPQRVPISGDSIDVYHSLSLEDPKNPGKRKPLETSGLLKVMYLPGDVTPELLEEIMYAFESASTTLGQDIADASKTGATGSRRLNTTSEEGE